MSRIDAEIKRRNKCGSSEFWDNTIYGRYTTHPYSDWGTDNQITSSHNSNIHISWKCKKNSYVTYNSSYTGTKYYCYYVDTSDNNTRLTLNQIYDENTQFKIRYTINDQPIYNDVSPETLQRYGVLEPTYTIDMPSISTGVKATAEDINTLIELLNTINTDTYWNTSTAVTAGNLIQTIIEISNTLTNLDAEHTQDVKTQSQINADKKAGTGNPLGNTSGCGSACKGLCQSCLGSLTSSGYSGDDGCTSGSSGDDGCGSGCSSTCYGGCYGSCGSSCVGSCVSGSG